MDRFYINELHGIYGNLLTEHQNEMLSLHYGDDLSFGEISQMFNISRAAVLNAVNKAETALIKFENALKVRETFNKIDGIITQGLNENADAVECLKNIKKILEN